MLGVDERADAALLLRLGDRVQRERRLTGAFRAIDFDDAAARQTADAESDVEADRAGGDGLVLDRLALAQAHDRTLAKSALDLADRRVDRPCLVRDVLVRHLDSAHQHRMLLLFHGDRHLATTRNGTVRSYLKAFFLAH